MSYSDRDGYIWMDGEFVPWRQATVHVLTHTLHYGVGVFEGIRAYKTARGTAVFRLDDHVNRLFESAHILQMDMPFDRLTIKEACLEAIRKNKLETGYVRPIAFYGSEGMGLHADNLSVHVAIAAWYWGAYLGADGVAQGIRVKTSSFARHHVNSVMCKAKACGNYLNSIMALREAAAQGYDEALLLNVHGEVMEGSGENIFLVRKERLATPPATSILEGITRDTLITLARETGLELAERTITRDELYIADEVFFVGTAAEVTPIREIDARVIGSGAPGPITRQLQQLYLEQVHGRRAEHPEWLSPV
jgi:branched-chain amino acid aminotransferase